MRIVLKIDKSLEQNSGIYFDKSKKDKKKLEGAADALKKSRKSLRKAKSSIEISKVSTEIKTRNKEWYEKFRWFHTSEGFLVIGGRDATTNEIIIKKHTEAKDIVFHTDMAGSPFFVIVTKGKKVGEDSMKEVADATASYSRAWKSGFTTTQVFHVKPDQVSKSAKSGESLPKGAFMIYGKTEYIDNKMRIAIAFCGDKIIGGPVESIKKQSDQVIEVVQGNEKPSDTAKRIKTRIGGTLDEIIRFLPSGGCEIAR